MRTLKDEERRLAQAAKKDNMHRQLEAQRQKVQNLRGMKPVFVSINSKKTEKGNPSSGKSKSSVSHEISSVREEECEIDEITIQQLRANDDLRHKVQKELKSMVFYLTCQVAVQIAALQMTVQVQVTEKRKRRKSINIRKSQASMQKPLIRSVILRSGLMLTYNMSILTNKSNTMSLTLNYSQPVNLKIFLRMAYLL